MAPADEYSAGGGGRLKLKGSNKLQDGSRVDKKKKKKKSKSKEGKNQAEGESGGNGGEGEDLEGSPTEAEGKSGNEDDGAVVTGKTETERRYEETRRRRLNERLKRDGVKSHKERVEELNRYLSTLSEHHDMPKIGPG